MPYNFKTGYDTHFFSSCNSFIDSYVVFFQADVKMRTIGEKCDLFHESGHVTDTAVDSRIDFHFNAMLDNVAEWRREKTLSKDVNLLGKVWLRIQSLSQDLETGCPKLAIVKFLAVLYFKGDHSIL